MWARSMELAEQVLMTGRPTTEAFQERPTISAMRTKAKCAVNSLFSSAPIVEGVQLGCAVTVRSGLAAVLPQA